MKPGLTLYGKQTIPYHSLKGNVEFKDVTFSYPTRPQHVSIVKEYLFSFFIYVVTIITNN